MSEMTLKAVLLGEDKSMSKSFHGAAKSAESSSKGIKGHLGGLSSALKGDFTGLTGSLTGGISKIGPWGAAAGAALGGLTAVAGAAGKVANESIDAFKTVAGETLKLQRVMGGTAEDASRMRFAFKETGVDADAGAKAIGILSKNLVSMKPKYKDITHHAMVATGEWRKQTTIVKDSAGHFQKLEKMVPVMKMKTWKETVAVANPVLEQLGINAKDASGHIRPMADLLPELADKFSKMPNGAEKSALALKLFGKGGLQLLPFLNRGKEGIAKLREESDKFGLTLSGKDLDALKKSRAAHKEWDAAMEGAKVRIGAQLLPMVTKLVTWFTVKMIPVIVQAGAWFQKHGDTIQHVAGVIGKVVVVMAKVWMAELTTIVKGFQLVAKVFTWLWNNVTQPIIHFILTGFAAIAMSIGHVLQALGKVPGFGWAKKAGDMMVGAAKGAQKLADNVNKIPDHKNVAVNISPHVMAGRIKINGQVVNVAAFASGTKRAPAGWKLVGEEGPELMNTAGGETILNARETARAMSGGLGSSGSSGSSGGSEQPLVVQFMLDGRVIQQSLLKVKRQGGVSLGLA